MNVSFTLARGTHERNVKTVITNRSEVRPAYKKKARDRLAPCSRPRLDASEENASEEAVKAEKNKTVSQFLPRALENEMMRNWIEDFMRIVN